MQMHNKMEIEGAASDAVRPSATDLRREAGQMRGFHSQSCRFGGENAAEAAEAQRYVNRKEVRVFIIALYFVAFLNVFYFDSSNIRKEEG